MANFYEDLAGQASDVESDVSDVNPADMAKMLQGLDDMDDSLFKANKKTKEIKISPEKTSRKASSAQDISQRIEKHHIKFDKALHKKNVNPKLEDEDSDWDDPLADILSSDESIGKSKQKTTQKKVTLQDSVKRSTFNEKSQKEKVLSDLFGTEDSKHSSRKPEEKEPHISNLTKQSEEKKLESYIDKVSKKTDSFSLNDAVNEVWSKSHPAGVVKKGGVAAPSLQKRGEHTENNDLLVGLGLETDKKPASNLFGEKSTVRKSHPTVEDIFKIPEQKLTTKETNESNTKLEQSSESAVAFGNYAPSLPSSRESRRSGVKRETSVGDHLGLFSPSSTPQRNQSAAIEHKSTASLQSPTPRRKPALDTNNEDKTDWLGLSSSKDHKFHSLSPERKRPEKQLNKSLSGEQDTMLRPPSKKLPEWLGGLGGHINEKKDSGKQIELAVGNNQNIEQNVPTIGETERLPTTQGLTLKVQNQMEQEAAYALQIQEQQLRTAIQLQQHEIQLANVHERQRSLLQQQEEQMQQLLSQQSQRQKQLENQLHLQQQKISNYLQALMTQPPTLPILTAPEETSASKKIIKEKTKYEEGNGTPGEPEPTDKDIKMQLTELQVTLQQCELEKKALESSLKNLETKHKEELQLIEDSYKRQISIVDEAMEKHVARLKTENTRIEEEYKERLNKMQDHLATLSESNAKQMANLQREHINDMQALKEQHSALLEHMKHIQLEETNSIKEASQNMTILQGALEQLGRNTGNLNEIQGWLEKQGSSQATLRELALKTKEAEVQAYKDNLIAQREAAEEERRKLLSLVEQLELQITQQRSKSEEERFSIRQDSVRLQSRIEAFEKEKESVKAELVKERQQLEKARQLLLDEQKNINLQLNEEKLSIARERARVQALAQLQGAAAASEDEMKQLRAEAEAALAVAKEATEHIEAQKVTIQEEQRHLEKERRRLQELEHSLIIRARELEALTQVALTTRDEGTEALASAVKTEERQKQRTAEFQRQLNEIREREQRLAEEKMKMSKERMRIHRHQEQKLCANCKNSVMKPSYSTEQSIASMDLNKYIDPKEVILKLVAERERDALLSSSLHSAPK